MVSEQWKEKYMESEKENKMAAEEIKELKERVSGGGGMMPMG